MAGPLTIQRVPRGLLHALAMKGTGDLPAQLAAETRAIFDASVLYVADLATSKTAGSGAISSDSIWPANTGAVPAGELWLVTNLTVQVSNVGAGTNFTIQPYWRRSASNSLHVVATPLAVPVNGDGVIGQQFSFGDLVLYPGDQWGILTTNGTYGLNPAATLNIDYFRLEF